MKKKYSDVKMSATSGTAIAFSIGEKDRQDALLIVDENDEFHNGDCILFGIDYFPESGEELIDLLKSEFPSTYHEDLKSFKANISYIF